MDSQLKRGLLDICVLKILCYESSYGYKIIDDLSKYIKISESTLYPILKRLEEAGHLKTHEEEHNGRQRRYYQTTKSGEKRLNDFKKEYQTLKKTLDFILGGNKNE